MKKSIIIFATVLFFLFGFVLISKEPPLQGQPLQKEKIVIETIDNTDSLWATVYSNVHTIKNEIKSKNIALESLKTANKKLLIQNINLNKKMDKIAKTETPIIVDTVFVEKIVHDTVSKVKNIFGKSKIVK
jgi:hypothetical protein